MSSLRCTYSKDKFQIRQGQEKTEQQVGHCSSQLNYHERRYSEVMFSTTHQGLALSLLYRIETLSLILSDLKISDHHPKICESHLRQMCGFSCFMRRFEGNSNITKGTKKIVIATLTSLPLSLRSCGRPRVRAFARLLLS